MPMAGCPAGAMAEVPAEATAVCEGAARAVAWAEE